MSTLFSRLLGLSKVSFTSDIAIEEKEMNSNTRLPQSLVSPHELALALENKTLEVFYQPQVNTNGTIRAAEAILRWEHHEQGYIGRSQIITVAEQTGLIDQISEYLINEVCLQLREWKNKELSALPITIKMSPLQLMQEGLVEYIKSQLDTYKIRASLVEIEVTAASIHEEYSTVLATLKDLKELGVRITLDVFGTGYTSLKYIKHFHNDTLKIDQAFIKDLDVTNKKDKTIISSILHLAKELDMEIIAEGVENHEQYQYLKKNECNYMQGMLFSKPVSPDVFKRMIKKGFIMPKQLDTKPKTERRKFYRHDFLYAVLGKMTVSEVNNKKVNLGTTEILIKDISLGGMKIKSNLNLPTNKNVKYKFIFNLMDESFQLVGQLRWKNEARGNTSFYGFEFELTQNDEDRLAAIMNTLSSRKNQNKEIPGVNYVFEDTFLYLTKDLSK
ncbi:EAL domain-containing protein [Oceanobacillus sp. CAU 1775]